MRVLLISNSLDRDSELLSQMPSWTLARSGDPLYGQRYDRIIVVGAVDPQWVERVVMCRLTPDGRFIALP